ncbi:MAG: UDP-N-acetylmuramate dehydrogenase [Candidatus Falkowbacteria bacterium]
MLEIKKNVLLADYTTLKIGSRAEFFAVIKNLEDLKAAIVWARQNKQTIFVLGGGSNLLITSKIRGLVIKNEIMGAQITAETQDEAWLTGNSGEIWSRFVHQAVTLHLYGLENLYLIYGTVGAAPVQNIGAYGVELKDIFDSLVAIDLQTGKEKVFKIADCQFGYRDSIFKKKLKGKYFIYQVTVKLSKKPKFKIDYADIKAELGRKKPNLSNVVAAIFKIRNSKLPNPIVLANAGSFFKNPEISVADFKKLAKKYPDIKSFPSGKKIKIPAGWLIERAGLKGKKFGPVSMYEKQALILVNHGGATASQVLRHIDRVQAAVLKQFSIKLEPEVNII